MSPVPSRARNQQAYISGYALERKTRLLWSLMMVSSVWRPCGMLKICQFELVEELEVTTWNYFSQVTIASGFPKGDKLEFILKK